MSLTNEDLLAISKIFDTRLDIRLKPIEKDIRELKEDVSALKEDVSALKEDVSALKEDVFTLKEDVSTLKEDVESLKTGLQSVKLFQENVIMPRLNTIESCYTDTYRRYQQNNDKMEAVFDDVDLLKKIALSHSEKLQKLA